MLERKVREEEEAAAAAKKEPLNTPEEATQTADDVVEESSETAEAMTEEPQSDRDEECSQLRDQLLRARAEFDNYRKRVLREMDQLRQTASIHLVRSLLPVLDNLERAWSHNTAADSFAEGVGMVLKQLQDVLAGEGLEPIPALHEVFDPNVHDALASMPSETVEAGRVMEEYERGYRMGGMVLRPARVIVSNGAPESEAVAIEKAAESTAQEDVLSDG